MLQYTIGNILESDAECLVNTVNCEGYMGKGIAYQFKHAFPANNDDYVRACRNGSLKVGTLHYFKENEKLIINFPTKDKWRAKSKMSYIDDGLSELVKLIPELGVKSIAIPPLGCGNGGLLWSDVRERLEFYLTPLVASIEILIYEPSKYFEAKSVEPPKLNVSHLVLMDIKTRLKKFNKKRLQKTAFFMNLFLGEEYFKFKKHKYGPYAHSIDILTKDIKQFQEYYGLNTIEALRVAGTMLTSKSTEQKLESLREPLVKAADFVNEIKSDRELELLASICSTLRLNPDLTQQEIIAEIRGWSQEKADKFSEPEIIDATEFMLGRQIIHENLLGACNLGV
jgi:O-acetyl-ADP-ribose deacetylase (regulator of RNase III)/uncharacterized protein YwgA